ncbi:MAG: HIT family protein [Candidatus Micrarchaeia archaeon]|jgi:histidine triad (HIT) family protein
MRCDLCEAIKKKEYVVFEDKYCACIVNIHPLSKAHLMVIPKRHVENLKDLNKKEREHFSKILGEASFLVQKYMKVNHSFIYIKEGEIKSEPHLHAHVLPIALPIRHLIAGFLKVPPKKKAKNEELRKMVEELRNIKKL